MPRTKLTMDTLCGDIKKDYEGKYQTILNKFKQDNASAGQYRDDLKAEKLKENRNTALSQARQLKEGFDKAILDRLNSKKTEYQEKLKGQQPNINEIFKPGNDIIALKSIYQAINQNSTLLQATNILNNGNTQSIGEFLDKNIDNESVRNLVKSYIKSKPENEGNYTDMISKINDAGTTEIDDIDELQKVARGDSMYSDQLHSGNLMPHNFQTDFPDTARDSYFNGSGDSNPYYK